MNPSALRRQCYQVGNIVFRTYQEFINHILYAHSSKSERALMVKHSHLMVGDKIHLHSKMGIYTIEDIGYFGILITCNTWIARGRKSETILYADFKCMAGFVHNRNKRFNNYLR